MLGSGPLWYEEGEKRRREKRVEEKDEGEKRMKEIQQQHTGRREGGKGARNAVSEHSVNGMMDKRTLS